ncbi:hypothetical protein N7532_004038 [Penicillium argentinense]|uniref:Uncharacterized protein n=1 Tax=Penicillium argentinense TaxID=1131581 RepID=A0A9W9FNL7_9EURO|nr:uncharacterized protein N7532_004038 [Penicillium argentinense]KAJ5103509.1 hypothetical protein N7532_004038 [Penicillium argentinense]
MSTFQLFPPPAPEVRGSKNPFRKGVQKPAMKAEPGSPVQLDEIKDSAKTESVLLQIIEDTKSTQSTQSFPPLPPVPTSQISRSKKLATGSSQQSRPAQSASSRSRQYLESAESSASSSSNSAHASSLTVSPQSSQSSVSPVPMRSMFPRFDPKVALNQQNNTPHMSTDAPARKSRRPNLTLTTTSDIDNVLGPKTVPASVVNFPMGVLESEEIQYSSKQDLETLWEAANGQRPQETCDLLEQRNLALPSTPSNPEGDVPIMGLNLEDRHRREYPNDDLVALIFSRLAAILAIEQAEEISKQHHLTSSEAADVESNALKQAAAQESCRLSWNRNLRCYELRHPSFSKRTPPALVGAAGIPLSPVRSRSSGILHITVSAPSSDASPAQPPTIIVTGPVSSTAMEAAQQAATARTSTLPVTDQDEPLAALDLATQTLSISPAAVIATIPSLYAIDSLIAAILAVAVSDGTTNPILADMKLGDTSRPSDSYKPSEPSQAPYRGRLITTLAEREDYAESLQLASQIEDANAKAETAAKRKSLFKFWDRLKTKSPQAGPSIRKGKNKKQQVVVEEIDLEKYGRYGHGSSREGEKLPGTVRTILKILFWGLELLVKGLTLAVKVLAWVLVRSTRCATSEKF